MNRLGRLVAAVVVGGILLGTAAAALRWAAYRLYPLPYRDVLVREGARWGEDPLLLAAIIRVESKWDPAATSQRGARGLMQMMPETGAWVARRLNWPSFQPELLYQPEACIALGATYFDYLRSQFGGSEVLALAAYNGGQGRVRAWLADRVWTGESASLGQIPVPETRDFVRRVLTDHRRYRMLYDATGRPRWP